MNITIGTCGNCGGRVSVPRAWMGIHPPVPRCESCGARIKNPWGEAIPMERPSRRNPDKSYNYSGPLPDVEMNHK